MLQDYLSGVDDLIVEAKAVFLKAMELITLIAKNKTTIDESEQSAFYSEGAPTDFEGAWAARLPNCFGGHSTLLELIAAGSGPTTTSAILTRVLFKSRASLPLSSPTLVIPRGRRLVPS